MKSLFKRERSGAIARELSRNQWLDRTQLHQIRTERLRRLLCAVGNNVPFYSEQLRSLGAKPETDNPWEVLHALPMIDKQAYRNIGTDLQAEHPRRKPAIGHTSGTTGQRLEIRIDRAATPHMYLAGFRGREWWGIRPGDPEVRLWGSGVRTARTWLEAMQASVRQFKDTMINVTIVSPFFTDEEDIARAARIVMRRKPRFVFGYGNSIYQLAQYMVRAGHRAGPGWPAAVSYTSEMLAEGQLATIKDAFGAPIVSEYGSCESGIIAYACPSGSLHTSDDILVVETCNDDERAAKGDLGEVCVTNLLSIDFPMIRYRQGDLARLSDRRCACGRSLGVMEELVGRLNDVLTSPSGGLIDFIVFDKAMKDQPPVRQFKVVETAPGELLLLCELQLGEEWPESSRCRLLASCKALLPKDVTLTVRTATNLPQEPSGKFRIMIPQKESARYIAA